MAKQAVAAVASADGAQSAFVVLARFDSTGQKQRIAEVRRKELDEGERCQ